MLTKDNANKVDWANIPILECMHGNALDAYYTVKVYGKLLEELRTKKLEKLYENLIAPLTPILAELEYDGLLIDPVKLAELKKQIQAKLLELQHSFSEIDFIPKGVNFDSSHDLIRILFSIEKNSDGEWAVDPSFGFGLYPFSKTDKGQPQTNEETLIQLKDIVDKEYSRRGLNVSQE